MMRRAWSIALLTLLAAPSPALGQQRIDARPLAAAPDTLPHGFSRVGGAVAYRPPSAGARPGLLVLFHGAGGNAGRFIASFQAEADRRGLILLSVQSADRTWDIVPNMDEPAPGRAPSPRSGKDAKQVNTALSALFGKMRIDPARIVAAGFSDGASYALNIGTANDHLFTGIAALAPGMLRGRGSRRSQRIAIAHGRDDRVLPFANARQMASQLRGIGYPVQFTDFAGGHQIDPPSLAASLDFALGR